MADQIQEIARLLCIQSNGDGLMSKIRQTIELLQEAAAERDQMRTELGDGTTGNKYRAELYDEVWQKARDMGFGNVTNALSTLEVQRAEQWSLRREAEAKVDTQAAVIAELQAELAKLRAVPEPVAWAVCREPGKVDALSAAYASESAAKAHVNSYATNGCSRLHVTPLYTAPATVQAW